METTIAQKPLKVKHSYGILLYRYNAKGKLEIFLGEANNPRYWTRKGAHWGIPKGRADKGEKGLETALREFEEEVGIPAPDLNYEKMMKFNTPHHKRITVFIANAENAEVAYGKSMIHRVEYPANSGVFLDYPELSDAQWFTKKKALKRVMWGQKGLVQLFFSMQERIESEQLELQLVSY